MKLPQVRTYSAGDAGSVQTVLHRVGRTRGVSLEVYFIDRLGNRSLRCIFGGTEDLEAMSRVGELEAVRTADGIIADARWMAGRG